MRLVVLIPLVAGMYPVEVTRLAWSILVFPIVSSRIIYGLFHIEKLFFFIKVFLRFGSIHGFLDIRGIRSY